MINLYSIIIGIFTIAGAVMALWSWRKMAKSKPSKTWPSTTATVFNAQASSEEYDGLPLVQFRYSVEKNDYEGVVEVPTGEAAAPDFAEHFLKKHPLHSELKVFHDPQLPEIYTLKPGINSEDRLMFIVGMGAFCLGLLLLLSNI